MVAHECAQQQARELVADRLMETEDGRRASLLDLVQAGAVLENESQATGV